MEVDDIDCYWAAIDVLEAREVLLQMQVSDYPNMNQRDRSNFHSEISRYSRLSFENESVSVEEVLRRINN